jgi:DNA repair exonuclease SbcCD ATPase subunit
MASGKNEHRMLFDLRGRRKNVVRVVYAVLAVLMGLSLFLVIGGFNLAELFSSSGSTGDAAKPYQEQAERIEVRLKKDPEDPNLLLSLTRAQINAGNAEATVEANGERVFTTEGLQEYQKAYQSWTDYLKATDEPSAGLALIVAPMLFQLAEFSRSYPEASSRVQSATEAQKIVAEQRPNLNSLTVLAAYAYFTGDFKTAEKAREEAKKAAGNPTEEKAIDSQLDQYKKQAQRYLKAKKKAEAAEKAAVQEGGGGAAPPTENLENPLFGGGGLSE